MSESAFNDNDPSVYKTHVLYVLPSDANCTKLLSLLEGHPINEDVYTQDVSLLKQRPAWLDGVPILVNKGNSQAHKGKNIYAYLKEWKNDELLPANASTGGYASFEHNGEHELGSKTSKSFSSLYDSGMFTMEEDAEDAAGASARAAAKGSPPSSQPDAASGSTRRDQQREQALSDAQNRTQQLIESRNLQDQRVKNSGNGNGGGRGGGGGRGPGGPSPPPQHSYPPQPPQHAYAPQQQPYTPQQHAPHHAYAPQQRAPQHAYPPQQHTYASQQHAPQHAYAPQQHAPQHSYAPQQHAYAPQQHAYAPQPSHYGQSPTHQYPYQ
jgi:hypothetical protein